MRKTVVQRATPAHFAGTPAQFQADADLLLQLRDGTYLPAHSALLASISPVLCKMLKFAASETPAGSKMVLPLTDFTEQEADDVLTARFPGRDLLGHGCCTMACQVARSLGQAPVRTCYTRMSTCCRLLGVLGVKGGVQQQTSTHAALMSQVIYPATSCGALTDRKLPQDREAQAADMRQALALLRWADKFGADEHLQRAERFLREGVRLMATVRGPAPQSCLHTLVLHQLER